MAGGEKKGLFGKLFRHKGKDQETIPNELEKGQQGAATPEPSQTEKLGDILNEAPDTPAIESAPSVTGEKTDIVELEMDIPEEEISTLALSLDDIESAKTMSDTERDEPGPEEAIGSFAHVQLETAEIDDTTVIKLNHAEVRAAMSVERAGTGIPSHADTSEGEETNGKDTIRISFQDVEADLAEEDRDETSAPEVDDDLDGNRHAVIASPLQSEAVRDDNAEATAVVPEGSEGPEGPSRSDLSQTRDQSQTLAGKQEVIVNVEEPEVGAPMDEENMASTSRETAGRLGFSHHVAPDHENRESQAASKSAEESPAHQEVRKEPRRGRTIENRILRGLRDTPLQATHGIDEVLGIQSHVAAMSNFIMNCQTPLCVSIQGQGGVGKSSFMRLLAGQLDDAQCLTTWFSSRDYSRFGDAKEVPALLIRRMLLSVERNVAEDKIGLIRQMIDEALLLMNSLWRVGFLVDAKGMATIEISEDADALAAIGENDAIAGLKLKLREIFNQGLESGKKKRIVVFVDDLDRTDPSLVLDLLETISTFLSIEHCVFVVACSAASLERGIRAVHGQDVVEDTGRSYFDRMFQLSVNLPAPATRLKEFVKELLRSACFDHSEETLNDVLPFLRYSVGINPRGIKRLANRLVFAGAINPEWCFTAAGETDPGYRNQKLILALGCLDTEFAPVFRLLLTKRDDDMELIRLINETLRDEEQIKDLDKEHALLGETLKTGDRVDKLVAFMDALSYLVHAGNYNKKLDRNDVALLRQAMDLISLTSTVTTEVSYEDPTGSALTEVCKRVKNRLDQILPGIAPDGSDKSIRSWPSPRPWFGFWYTDNITKKVWGRNRVYYHLSFDTAKGNAVSIGLKCNTSRLGDFGVDSDAVDRLRNLTTLTENQFQVNQHDSGWLEIVKVLHECTCGRGDEVSNDDVETIANEMKELVRATHEIFDPRPRSSVIQPDKQRQVKRSIPPCKVCGSELRVVAIKNGGTGFRCDKCRKIYKPKATKANG